MKERKKGRERERKSEGEQKIRGRRRRTDIGWEKMITREKGGRCEQKHTKESNKRRQEQTLV